MLEIITRTEFIRGRIMIAKSAEFQNGYSLAMKRIGVIRYCNKKVNPLALELDIYSLAHHLCKM